MDLHNITNEAKKISILCIYTCLQLALILTIKNSKDELHLSLDKRKIICIKCIHTTNLKNSLKINSMVILPFGGCMVNSFIKNLSKNFL